MPGLPLGQLALVCGEEICLLNICLDVDECAALTHLCTQGCNNTKGSYICTCNEEFYIPDPDTPFVRLSHCLNISGESAYQNVDLQRHKRSVVSGVEI